MHIRELRVSYAERTPTDGNEEPVLIKGSREAIKLMAPLLEVETVEVCYVLCLTTGLGLIGYHQVSRGSLDQVPMHPREVYKIAILANAAGIVLLHNHPSGDPTPSPDDLAMTRRIKKAGDVIGIDLLDHIIIGHQGRYVSVKEQGRF